jgi:hypothetical protein
MLIKTYFFKLVLSERFDPYYCRAITIVWLRFLVGTTLTHFHTSYNRKWQASCFQSSGKFHIPEINDELPVKAALSIFYFPCFIYWRPSSADSCLSAYVITSSFVLSKSFEIAALLTDSNDPFIHPLRQAQHRFKERKTTDKTV